MENTVCIKFCKTLQWLEVGKGQQNLYECANLNRGYLVTMQSIKGLIKTLTNANISCFLQRWKWHPTVSFNFKAKLLEMLCTKLRLYIQQPCITEGRLDGDVSANTALILVSSFQVITKLGSSPTGMHGWSSTVLVIMQNFKDSGSGKAVFYKSWLLARHSPYS